VYRPPWSIHAAVDHTMAEARMPSRRERRLGDGGVGNNDSSAASCGGESKAVTVAF
jgi:hypothetical protein